jgi:protein-disulfide isomerase
MKLRPFLLVLALVAGCYRTKTDDATMQRLARIEQRLDAQDQAIAEARTRADTTELAALAQQIAELRAELDRVDGKVKAGPLRPRPSRVEPDPALTYAVPIGQSPVYGSPRAKVTMVMAMDFACPFCRRAFDTVDDLRKRYGKDLRVVYKPMVVHPSTARIPALAACAAQQQGKWREMADLIWNKGFDLRSSNPDWHTADHMAALAKQLRLDMKRYARDVDGVCVGEIAAEEASMKKLGVAATPTFFINGRYLAGARPIDDFAKLIDEELAKANDAIKHGVKADHYYDQEILAKGQAQIARP